MHNEVLFKILSGSNTIMFQALLQHPILLPSKYFQIYHGCCLYFFGYETAIWVSNSWLGGGGSKIANFTLQIEE